MPRTNTSTGEGSLEEGTKKSRRLPTKTQLRVWRDFIETSEALRSTLASRMQNASKLSLADYQVLLTLSEAESSRLRSSELAARVGWERSRLSHHLGRMERRGLIRREPCPDDSRGAEVVLTEAGQSAFKNGSRPHLEDVQELFVGALSERQLEAVGEAVAAVAANLERLRFR